ncbi:MAG: rhamnulokinase [Oscillospiraceae bacterium]|jgi:rhamnulokinase|nr:rhamnulokinase [Oscillospiraceae bacterium]
MTCHLAIDIGASSGRHVLGFVEHGRLTTREVYRFENEPVRRGGHLCWDAQGLFRHIVAGMRQCRAEGLMPDTLAIDTWGVDFALLDADGGLLGDTIAYRDQRTRGMEAAVERILPFADLYARTGIQKQPFNTIYQLTALQRQAPGMLERADALLMMPDYLNYLLTGERQQEYTNATTTALVNAGAKRWDGVILDKLNLPRKLFGRLSLPGEMVGELLPAIAEQVGFRCRVLHAASHDTASAFMAVPARSANAAFLSSGTWSLLGLESASPIATPAAQTANFTNEGGYGYRYRFLKNIMGLWMIQSIRREYGKRLSYAELEQAAREASHFPGRVDVNNPAFLAPDSMAGAIREACHSSGEPAPETPGEMAACIYQSLAAGYADAIRELEQITGKTIEALHIVGGGSKDDYLNRLTAQKTGLPVYAGPTEGTVIGNLLAQMIAVGTCKDLAEARACVAESFPIKAYEAKEDNR